MVQTIRQLLPLNAPKLNTLEIQRVVLTNSLVLSWRALRSLHLSSCGATKATFFDVLQLTSQELDTLEISKIVFLPLDPQDPPPLYSDTLDLPKIHRFEFSPNTQDPVQIPFEHE